MSKNPYEKWIGFGQVEGRDHIYYLDENDEDTDAPYTKDDATELGLYVPMPGDGLVRFALRVAPDKPTPKECYLQLLLAGPWDQQARDALEPLKFRYKDPKNSLLLESNIDISGVETRHWESYGKVEVRELFLPDHGIVKVYSRVKFRHLQQALTKEDKIVEKGAEGPDGRPLTVGAYWCWPY